MEPEDFCVFARDCLSLIPTEAGRRSAVSRAYYAAFHACDRYVKAGKLPIPDVRGDHEKVIRAFADGVPREHHIVQALWALKRNRIDADYVWDAPMRIRNPSNAVAAAEKVVAWFSDQPWASDDR